MRNIEELKKRLRHHDDERLYREADVLMSEAADTIESLQRELEEVRKVRTAAENLIKQKGRHNTEIAYQMLADAVAPRNQKI